ncbi:MAG: NAD-dependent epimerase/dehydratase family protein [Patescibacteria group bacterium]
MKILVTGGAGFIASHIVDAYINLGFEVVVLDNLSSGKKKFVNPRAKFYQEDLLNLDKVKKILLFEKPDIINHHAAQISVRNSVNDPLNDSKINILGFINVLETAKDLNIKKVIFASSGGAIYGDAKILPTPETYQPLIPLSPYGINKLTSEFYLNYYYHLYKIPFIALRYSNVYGPRQNPHGEAGVVAIFTLKLLKGIPSVINGDGRQTRDYIFVEDIVSANISAVKSDFVGAINIATSHETDVNELYRLLKITSKINIEAKFGPVKHGEQLRSSLDISQAKKILFNWMPKTDLQKGLKKTIDYFSKYEK